MATTRTPISRNKKTKITPEVIAAYIKARDGDGDACLELDQLLGRQLWEVSIADTIGLDAPPGWMVLRQPKRISDWHKAHDIRVELDRAA
jgi:hypothetical protein